MSGKKAVANKRLNGTTDAVATLTVITNWLTNLLTSPVLQPHSFYNLTLGNSSEENY